MSGPELLRVEASGVVRGFVAGLLIVVASVSVLGGTAQAATGDIVHAVTLSHNCGSFAIGLAFDGEDLWYSCDHGVELHRVDPITGVVEHSYDVAGYDGLGGLGYDPGREGLWSIGFLSSTANDVLFFPLSPTHEVTGQSLKFALGSHGFHAGWWDGLGYDPSTDQLYFSDDQSTVVHSYTAAGAHVVDFPWIGTSCYNSGVEVATTVILQAAASCNLIVAVDKTVTTNMIFAFPTDASTHDEDLACDRTTFAPTEVVWSVDAFGPSNAVAYEVPAGTCPDFAKPPVPVPELRTAALMAIGLAALGGALLVVRARR